ncbi:class I SAM-dependent methyltransferase [Desulfoluna spongiiphila]|uniref:class I SAM-dependent methyltransferase n=1 Tax=Desulfoluna spongiiphila TaxID=419481 RepID=UPI001251D1EF|nr:class I SAM-dependent methyltransferase [Desulfoluna spongiiphila]VVS94555.1 s-adenosyl-l-methionine-dependent methyltransferase [Desulfoluna spongiiphila]
MEIKQHAEEATLAQRGQDNGFLLTHYEKWVHPLFLSLFTTRFVAFEAIYTGLVRLAGNRDEVQEGPCHVLDLACGTGWFGRKLAREPFYRDKKVFVDGVDLSRNAVDAAQGLYEKEEVAPGSFKLWCCGAHDMAMFEDGRFHEVWLCGALHQIPGVSETIREVNRVLKPGGILCCQTFVCSKNPLINAVQQRHARASGHRYFEFHELEACLEEHGLSVRARDTCRSVVLFTAVKRRRSEMQSI